MVAHTTTSGVDEAINYLQRPECSVYFISDRLDFLVLLPLQLKRYSPTRPPSSGESVSAKDMKAERLCTCKPWVTTAPLEQVSAMAPIRISALDWICFALLIVGAVNWGILGLIEINVLAEIMNTIFQEAPAEFVLRATYVFVGLAGIYLFYPLYRLSRGVRREADEMTVE